MSDKKITQEELDEWLFNNHSSPNPFINEEYEITIICPDDTHLTSTGFRKLDEGGFSTIYLYSFSEIKYVAKFAFELQGDKKIIKYNEDGTIKDGNEKKALISLKDKSIREGKICSIIKGKIVDSKIPSTIMPLMDGNLLDLINEMSVHESTKRIIVESVRSQMECILSFNSEDILNDEKSLFKFAYMDLKPSNILYKLVNREYIFKIGDLGSIVPSKDNHLGIFPATYYTQIKELERTKFPKSYIVRSMRYLFGLFCYNLMINEFTNIDRDDIYDEEDLEEMNFSIITYLGDNYDNLINDQTNVVRKSMYG
jgi:hypothetical protein